MQIVEAPPPPPLPGLLFTWTVPAGLEWQDLAARHPHRPLARVLVGALAKQER